MHQPRIMMDVDEYGAIGGLVGSERESLPLALCPLQIPHCLTRVRTLAAAGGCLLS
jgi:hypothetical protein